MDAPIVWPRLSTSSIFLFNMAAASGVDTALLSVVAMVAVMVAASSAEAEIMVPTAVVAVFH